jgi:NDP-sugar pyrophosphorylase family protein
MDVIILVGGYARRLWPLTQDKPKTLLKIMGKEILSYILDNLNNFDDVGKIYVSTNREFKDHFFYFLNKNVHYHHMHIELIIEPHATHGERLGPIGGLGYILDEKGAGDYMVIAGDNMFKFSLSDFFNFYRRQSKSVIALQKPPFLGGLSQFGIVELGNKYLFNWNDVPGNDTERFREFLVDELEMDWAKNGKIEKSDENKTIKVSHEENFLTLSLNEEKNKVTLKEGNGKTHEYILEKEDDKLRIYDDNITDEIKKLDEKPIWPENTLISTGCYILRREDFDLVSNYIRRGKNIDSLGRFMKWLAEDKKRGIKGYKFTSEWFDVGTLDTLLLANLHYLRSDNLGDIRGTVEIKNNVYINEGTIIKDSRIGPNVYIGKNCVVTDSKISDALIYDNVIIDVGEIQHSVIDEGSRVAGKISGIIAK